MIFADQWANRHDGECEHEMVIDRLASTPCHCYRRWLEARLEIAQEQLALGRKTHAYIAFVLTGDGGADSQLAADRAAERIRVLREALEYGVGLEPWIRAGGGTSSGYRKWLERAKDSLLPPKGAAE